MSIAMSLEQMARRLETYQQQLTALSHALDELRTMSDDLIVALQADSAAVAEQLQLVQAASIDDAPALEAVAATDLPTAVADHEAAGELAAGPVEPVESVELTAIDTDAVIETGEVIEPAAIEIALDLPVLESDAATLETAHAEVIAQPADAAPVAEPAAEIEPSGITEASEVNAALAQVAQIATSSSQPAIDEGMSAGENAAIHEQQAETLPVCDTTAAASLVAAETAVGADVASEASTSVAAAEAITADRAVEAPAAEATASNVVDLAAKRQKRFGKPVRRAAAIAAMLVITAGATFGFNELVHSELGQRIMELGACDAEMVSANRDCAFLSWLTL